MLRPHRNARTAGRSVDRRHPDADLAADHARRRAGGRSLRSRSSLKNFYIFQITLAIIYAIAILGLNLLTGFNGQFSLGHSAFYAIGAYTAAIMMENLGLSYVWTLPAAAIVCFVFGFLFGLPALRLEGIYLALATFALAIAMPQVLKSSAGRALDRRRAGHRHHQAGRAVRPAAQFRPVALLSSPLAVAIVMYRLRRQPGEEPHRPRADRDPRPSDRRERDGHQRRRSTSRSPSGSARSIPASPARSARSRSQFVAPDSFTFVLAVALFVGLVVGGVGSIPGTLVGGFFVLFVPNIAESVSKGLAGAVYGVILMLVIYVMPTGAAGLVRLITGKMVRQGR